MAIDNITFVMASLFPKKLAEFYALITEGELKTGLTNEDFCIFVQKGIKIHLYKPSSNSSFPLKGNVFSLSLNSKPKEQPMEYLDKWLNSLFLLGASVSVRPKLQPFGAEAWIKDPEGNSILVFVPTKKESNNV